MYRRSVVMNVSSSFLAPGSWSTMLNVFAVMNGYCTRQASFLSVGTVALLTAVFHCDVICRRHCCCLFGFFHVKFGLKSCQFLVLSCCLFWFSLVCFGTLLLSVLFFKCCLFWLIPFVCFWLCRPNGLVHSCPVYHFCFTFA